MQIAAITCKNSNRMLARHRSPPPLLSYFDLLGCSQTPPPKIVTVEPNQSIPCCVSGLCARMLPDFLFFLSMVRSFSVRPAIFGVERRVRS